MSFLLMSLLLVFHPSLLARLPAGGGGVRLAQDFPCLTNDQRDQIRAQLQEGIQALQDRGTLARQYSSQSVSFGFPLAPAPGFLSYGFHGISEFVDHDPAYPDHVQDYYCGDRSYDLPSGYNHQGTDFFLWPFSWYRMDHDQVYVIAAASGVIVLKQDGNFDRNCGFNGDAWNAVYVQHSDGSVGWYGHLKNGSLTTKGVGDSVALGERLGVVGSSGNSTGPHLHFEVYDRFDNLIDPYEGLCNLMNPDSWWADQPPYYDSAINQLMTHSAAPEFPPCPQQEILHESDDFTPGDTVFTAAYYRDQLGTQFSTYYILRPDDSVFQSWTYSSDAPYYNASYWYWWWPLPQDAPDGIWTFKVVYLGNTYVHHFTVGPDGIDEQDPRLPVTTALFQNSPNPFNPETTIQFTVGSRTQVALRVYDARGRKVRTLVNEDREPGDYSVQWEGTDDAGQPVASGVYLCRLVAGSHIIAVRKVVLSR